MASASPSTRNRPLSPHLQIYRPQITSVLSITHRITGVCLAIGTLLLAHWLGAAAYGPDVYAKAMGLIGSWFGKLCLFGWSFCLFFHLSNGIRHLFWDSGRGFEKDEYHSSGKMVVVAALTLTVIVWAIALSVK